ncbi:MAG TPA: hypothetical protein VJM08_16645 [Anaerolineales bacterium]|nr:hypothetical protein [Anaerolineales bacterium]
MTEAKNPKVIVLRRTREGLQSEIRPIVIDYKKRRRNKRRAEEDDEERYSEGLEDVQRLEGNLVRVAKRSANAFSKGIDTYEQERNRSAKEKKDGVLEDFIDNSAKAASASMKEASELPIDIAEVLSGRSNRKRVRKSLRRISGTIRLFRI